MNLVHPDLRAIVPDIEAYMASQKPLSLETLPALREADRATELPVYPDVPHEKRMIPVGAGQPEVAIYVVNAKPGSRRPAILHMHPGGFITGSARNMVRNLQEFCKELDCVAVSVEYRLAPETRHAGSIEDNYAALKWLHANAAVLGADPNRIAVMGESAGGGHAALLAILARDRGEVPICFQCLIYPMLDDRTGSTRTAPPNVGTLFWTPPQNAFAWECFLGTKPGGPAVPKGAVPARAENLRGLPPTFIGVGTLDLFCAEGMAYASRLKSAGVATELIVVPGAFHGFDNIGANASVGKDFHAKRVGALRRGFGQYR